VKNCTKLVNTPTDILARLCKQISSVDITKHPFSHTIEPKANENVKAYMQRRAMEITSLYDIASWLEDGLNLETACSKARNVGNRMKLKTRGWVSESAMMRATSLPTIAPAESHTPTISSRQGKTNMLLQHQYCIYTPSNKNAKQHLVAIRDLGFRNFRDLPIDFSYYEPSLSEESSSTKNARRQTECREMDGWIEKAGRKPPPSGSQKYQRQGYTRNRTHPTTWKLKWKAAAMEEVNQGGDLWKKEPKLFEKNWLNM